MAYLEIPFWRLSLAAVLIAVSMLLSWASQLNLEKELGLGAIRAAIQLVAIGYALRLIFAAEHPAAVFGVVAVMWIVAAWTSTRRVKSSRRRELFPRALVAIGAGAAAALLPVFLVVIPPHPWFEARYVIPIGGMMLSSAMNVVALVFERLFASARTEGPTIEQALALGATPSQALAPFSRAALRAALIPTINGLVTVGLVALPGMMTGQIVSGASPDQAVRYQIVVMYQLVVVAAVAGVVSAFFVRTMLFTPDAQLRDVE